MSAQPSTLRTAGFQPADVSGVQSPFAGWKPAVHLSPWSAGL